MRDQTIQILDAEGTLQYEKLACIAFHSRNEGLLDPQTRLTHIAEGEEKNRQDTTSSGNYRTRTGLFQDGKLLSALTAHAFEVNFDGHTCEMCGIGGVMSDPTARKTGGASRILRHELAEMKKRGQILSHLSPFKTSFYRKFGYTHCAYAQRWEVPTQFLPDVPYAGLQWFENTETQQQALKELYQQFAVRYNMALHRRDTRWLGILSKLKPYREKVFSYLHEGADGPDGFLSYHILPHEDKPLTILVDHLYYTCPDALRQLLAFLRCQAPYADLVQLKLPLDTDISFWLEEICTAYDKRNVKRELIHQGATRVVDVEGVLKLARYLGAGTANIRVQDPDCPWNDKTFHVEFDGSCRSIGDAEDWDIRLDICAFTTLIMGSCDLSQAAYMDGVEIRKNEENLRKIFYQKPLWIGDSF